MWAEYTGSTVIQLCAHIPNAGDPWLVVRTYSNGNGELLHYPDVQEKHYVFC
jgi:hypothetical protein